MTDTDPPTPTQEGRKRRGGLFVNDTEILERLGVPEAEGRRMLRSLDEDKLSGFPKRDERWGNRRWWPAVQEFFDRLYALPEKPKAREWVRPERPPMRRTG